MTNASQGDSGLERLGDLVESLTLVNIRCIKVSAELNDASSEPPSRIVVELPDKVAYATGEGFLAAKFPASVTAFDQSGVATASVDTVHLLEHSLAAGYPGPTEETLSIYLHTNGFFMVYPYIRQAVQDAFARIGYGNLVLGIISRDTALPVQLEMILQVGSDDESPSVNEESAP